MTRLPTLALSLAFLVFCALWAAFGELAPARAQDDAKTVVVRVQTLDGKPLTDVRVTAWTPAVAEHLPPVEMTSARSGEDGRARLRVPRFPVELRGASEELYVAGERLDGPSDGAVVLFAVPCNRVPYRVADEEGNPIEGATVWWSRAGVGDVRRSDARGEAPLWLPYCDALPKFAFDVRVSAPGFEDKELVPFDVEADTTPWEAERLTQVQLRRGTPLTVRVLEADGTPASGAMVTVGDVRRTTGDDGNAEFEAVRATAESGVNVWTRCERDVHLRFGRLRLEADGTTTIRLPAARTVRGRAVAGRDGKPVAGATVLVQDRHEGARAVARTASDGTFEMHHVPGAAGKSVRLTILAPGLCSEGRWMGGQTPEEGRIAVKLVTGRAVRGRVVDGAGRPFGGARVWIWSRDRRLGAAAESVLSTRSAKDGSFRIGGIPEVRGVEVRVTAEGFGIGRHDIGHGVDNVVGDVALPAPITLRTHFVDRSGEPIRRAAAFFVFPGTDGLGVDGLFRSVVDGRCAPVPDMPEGHVVVTVAGAGLERTRVKLAPAQQKIEVGLLLPVAVQVLQRANGRPVQTGTVGLEYFDPGKKAWDEVARASFVTGFEGGIAKFHVRRRGRFRFVWIEGDEKRPLGEPVTVDAPDRTVQQRKVD